MKENVFLLFLFCMVILNMAILNLMADFRRLKWHYSWYAVPDSSASRERLFEMFEMENTIHIEHSTSKLKRKSVYPEVVSQPYKLNNKNICRGVPKVSTLVIVHTAPRHFKRRQVLRETMLNATYYSPETVKVVFLLGLVLNEKIQIQIENESTVYKDIVQGFFIDSYRNLTNKGVLGYRWISEHCMNAEFITKIDDDVFINFFKVFEEMNKIKQRKRYILCNKIHKYTMRIVRNKRNKWYVSDDYFYGFQTYPHTYCSGVAVFLTTDLIPMLYKSAFVTPFFWVDDFYLFGILPSKIQSVKYEKLRTKLTFHFKKAQNCYEQHGMKCPYAVVYVSRYGDRGFHKLWLAVVKDRQQSVYGNYYMDLPALPCQNFSPLASQHF